MIKCAKYHQDTLPPWEYLKGDTQHFWNFKAAYLPSKLFIKYQLLVTINLWNCIYSSQMYFIFTSLTGEQCSVNIFFAQKLWSKSMKHDKLVFSLWFWSFTGWHIDLPYYSTQTLNSIYNFARSDVTLKYSHSIWNRSLYNGLIFKLPLMWLSWCSYYHPFMHVKMSILSSQ